MTPLSLDQLSKMTLDQEWEMVCGYLDGGRRLATKKNKYYLHGYRVGRNDQKGIVEPFQAELAYDMARARIAIFAEEIKAL